MTAKHIADGSITTKRNFEAVLAAAVEQAINADLDVRGAWEFETGGSVHHWEVEIYELAKDIDEETE
jgi:hypothetical protein